MVGGGWRGLEGVGSGRSWLKVVEGGWKGSEGFEGGWIRKRLFLLFKL